MARNKMVGKVIEEVTIVDAGSEGKGVGRKDERVIFVPYTAPGDVVDVVVTKKRSSYMEGRVKEYRILSPDRTEPPCRHFGLCGGCKWQHLPYEVQLKYKHKVVIDNFKRIGGIEPSEIRPIIASEQTEYYRNKLEYTFSSKRWFEEKPSSDIASPTDSRALGFHMPGMFDRILDIGHCHLQADPSNQIRLSCRELALKSGHDFYDTRSNIGFFRNLIIRTAGEAQVMVILVVGEDEPETVREFLSDLAEANPQITSLWYIINTKKNDSIGDLEPVHFSGTLYLEERMEDLMFRVGPKSFFQTNSSQALQLYRNARELAALTGTENVYDLYCGTGTIALFVASKAAKVCGVEYIEEAVGDADDNAIVNGISNASFVAGDLAKVLTEAFVEEYGKPDVVITDPPRAGMHPDVIARLLEMSPSRIVYVSCNPATQARDCAMLAERYSVDVIQPVDMFPHTHHVENIALLRLRS